MAQQSNDLRERLLAALPQPENLAAYREETAALLTKHAVALRWDKIAAYTILFIAMFLYLWSFYPGRLGAAGSYSFRFGSGVLFFVGAFYLISYKIYDSQIATLKEVKQVQLQILELQGTLRRNR
ncbi:MAG: hypothetical protein ACRD3F_08290 [Acidobacteriaceae bacterium]